MNISSTLKNIFGNTKCKMVFRKNTSLKQVTGRNTIEKKIKKPYITQNNRERKTFILLHSLISMVQVNNT